MKVKFLHKSSVFPQLNSVMFLISVNATEGKLSAGIMNEETKCVGRMNAAKIYAVSRNEENMNAANMSAWNETAENKENETAGNYASLNANATTTNADSATEITTTGNASNLSAGKNAGAIRKHLMTFSAIFSDGN